MSEPPPTRPASVAPRPLWFRALRGLAYALVALYFVKVALELDWATLERTSLHLPWLAAMVGGGWLHRSLMVATWAALVDAAGGRIRDVARFNAYSAKSWMGRYLPGKVALVVGRARLAPELGLRSAELGLVAVLESLLHLCVAALLGLSLMGLVEGAPREVGGRHPLLLVGALSLSVVAAAVAWRSFGTGLLRKLRVTESGLSLRRGPALAALLLSATASLAGGVLCASALASVTGEFALQSLVYLWASMSLASVAGILAVVVPGGIGVREAALVPLLAQVVSLESALIAALLLRAAEVVVDLSYLGLSQLASYLVHRRTQSRAA